MPELTPQQELPKTFDFVRALTAQPTADHTDAWNDAKSELTLFLDALRRREESHRDNKLETLKKWEAKAGMLEKKHMAIVGLNAGEHDQMFAAGVPGHIMSQFREEDEALVKENRFFDVKVQQLRDLGISSVNRKWVVPWKQNGADEKVKEG